MEHFANGGTCFLSPHPDDTVMSALFVIKDSVLPKPYYLFTIFGDSDFAPYLDRSLCPDEQVSTIRQQEDEAFSQEVGMEYLSLMAPCCLKKLGHVIFDPLAELDEVLLTGLQEKIHDRLAPLNISNIVVQNPFGDRQHYDHRLVKEIGRRLADKYGYKVFLLDDIPYSSTVLTDKHLVVYERQITGEALVYKHKTMNIYASQMMASYHNFIDANNFERLFIEKIR